MSEPLGNLPEFTVTELSSAIKRAIEDGFAFVRVRGELGRVSRPHSGHVYLDLKDDRAVLSGVIWKGVASRLRIQPEQGMEVIATGKLTTFPGQSRYQIVIDSLEPAGVGALMALYEERKKKLAGEGLFAAERKKELPFLPRVIGVVTSPSGAVIRDILHRLRERFASHVLVWPTVVQGKGAEDKIAAAIEGFNALPEDGAIARPDLLIVARGGGSLEDLWCFNEEVVARAAAASAIPLISAVGHETDTTLIDYAADKRAPTPTAAAEMATPVRSELLAELLNKERRMVAAVSQGFERRRTSLVSAGRGLGRPADLLGPSVQRLDRAGDQLRAALRARLDGAVARLAGARLSHQVLRQRHGQDGVRLQRARERLAGALAGSVEKGRARSDHAGVRLRAALSVRVGAAAAGLRGLRLPHGGMRRQTQEAQAALRERWRRLAQAEAGAHDRRARRLASSGQLLQSLSYENVLKRGYAIVRDETGAVIRSAGEGQEGAGVSIRFGDGARAAVLGEPLKEIPQIASKTTKQAERTVKPSMGEPKSKKQTARKEPDSKNKAGAEKGVQKSLFD